MTEINKFVEVDRKEYLTLLAPVAEKIGVDLQDIVRASMDHSGVEFEYMARNGVGAKTAERRVARIHVFDPVVY